MAEDRAGADDRHVEAVGGRPQAGPLGGQLGVAVGLLRAWARWSAAPGSPRARRTPRSTTCAPPWRPRPRRAASRTRVPSTLTVRSRWGSLASGTWATLWYTTSTPSTASRTAARVADVALHELDAPAPPVAVGVDVEHPDGVAPRARGARTSRRAEVAAAAGDQARVTARAPARGTSGCCAACPPRARPAGRSRARRGRRRCRRRWSCPSRRARGAAGRSGRCAGAGRRPSRPIRPTRAGRRSRLGFTSKPSALERPADRVDDLVDGVRRGRRRSTSPARRASACSSAATTPCDEVVDVHHRAPLLAVADDREAAGADHAEERGLAGRLERSVEPRRADDHRVEPRLDGVEHRAARPASSSGRSRSTGGTARRCGTCRWGGGWCRTGCSTRRARPGARPGPARRASTFAVPRALTSSNSAVRCGWITPGGVDHVDGAGEPGEERVERRRAGGCRRRPARRGRERRRTPHVLAGRGPAPARSRPGVGPAGRGQVVDEGAGPSQPAAPVTHGDVRRGSTRVGVACRGLRHALTVSTNRRALRMANAITERLRVDARCVGEQRGVVDVDVLGAVDEAEAVGRRTARPRRCGTVEHRCTVITLACVDREGGLQRRRGRAGCARPGAPRYDG